MLTNAMVKGAAAGERPYKLADGGGLYLYVAPTGLRSWRMKFRFGGKEKLLTFGTYPDVSLVQARACRDDARGQLRQHVDPSGGRRRADAADAAEREREMAATFEATARRWHAHQLRRWTAVHAADVLASLDRDAFPELGAMPLAAIDAPAVLRVLRAVEVRGRVETARRLRQRISAVFAFAMSEGVASHDPAAIVAKALLPSPPKRRQPAIVDVGELRALIAAVDAADGAPITKLASLLLALTAVRLAAIRGARWDEFADIDWTGEFVGPLRPVWRVPPARMKLAAAKKGDDTFAHVVPLSAQAVDVVRAARSLAGRSDHVFPGRSRGRPLSETAIGSLYVRAGFGGRHVPHGWRAAFSTIMNERNPGDRAVIDLALAHAPKDKVEAAYNRAEHLARRRRLFQAWAELLLAGCPSDADRRGRDA